MLEKYYKNALEDAKNSLLDDGVIIVPTDTIYGLACLSSSKVAIDRIYDMKQRGRDKPLPLIVDTYDRLLKVVDVDLNVVKKLSKYFPGPVTLVCKRNPDFDFFDAETVAVRMVNVPLVNKIIESVDAPLCLTSANLSP